MRKMDIKINENKRNKYIWTQLNYKKYSICIGNGTNGDFSIIITVFKNNKTYLTKMYKYYQEYIRKKKKKTQNIILAFSGYVGTNNSLMGIPFI